MKNKICLVTGANSGLGKAVALELASSGATVVLLCRDQERGNQARVDLITRSQNLKIHLMLCDLSSMSSVRRFARAFRSKYPHLDVLANMAGIRFPYFSLTEEGFELNFATNVLGPFLLTNSLINLLIASGSGHIINVSGEAHRIGAINFADPQMNQGFSISRSISQTALARVLWTYELANRLRDTGVAANTFAPGMTKSAINRHYPFLYRLPAQLTGNILAHSPGEAVRPVIRRLLRQDNFASENTGLYLLKGLPGHSEPITYDGAVRRKLWSICEELTHSSLQFIEDRSACIPAALVRGQATTGAIWRQRDL